MIRSPAQTRWLIATATGATLLVAGCGEKAPPPRPLPPPPPPPVVVVIPPKPTPPNQASPDLTVPQTDATGLRVSVNRNITPAQTVWNLRSAYNVAALNCRAPEHAEIVPNYRAFLKAHDKGLAKANRTVDAEFKGKYGAGFIVPRERYMTEVYNHFALPPTMTEFCTAVLAVSRDGLTLKPAELEAFAQRSLPSIEVVFDDFYRRYDAYRTALADWNARYGQPAPTTAPSPGVMLPVTVPAASGSR
ncbi:hypothetical protein H7F50_18450 [Novosphingobium flavum]|uniref:hypothetical protein n=1 Tax=Novosphingobium aerophilum TaxID=2839843 RepID=UPI001639A89D|nr:hypothetical protein [Novosphingobium aerophilum]MBC2663701.1 hypothetical protein [Novosphingobium aerophilum]